MDAILTMRPSRCSIIERTAYFDSNIGETVLSWTKRCTSRSSMLLSIPLVPNPALLMSPYTGPKSLRRPLTSAPIPPRSDRSQARNSMAPAPAPSDPAAAVSSALGLRAMAMTR